MTPPETTDALPSFDYSKESARFQQLIGAWTSEADNCTRRRELRQNKKSVQEERQKGTILEDETIIPDRTIASNIRRSKVAYENYITQSKRILIITDVENPSLSVEPLEEWFTRGMRYPGWKKPYVKLIDSMHVHGGAPMEVVYDPEKPLNNALEFIPRYELIIPLKTRNIQSCPRILRQFDVTATQLEEFQAIFKFEPSIVKDLFDKLQNKDEFVRIYRVLMKIEGLVYNAWYAKDSSKDWLRAPVLHDIGLFEFDPKALLRPVPVMGQMQPNPNPMMGGPSMMPSQQMIPLYLSPQWTQVRTEFMKPAPLHNYPIFWFPFQLTECEEILDEQGRVSMDLHVQEAMTSLLSDTVNGAHRAAGLYPCVENEPGGDPNLLELGPVKSGIIMSRRIILNQFPWPNPVILPVMQALKIGKADESGQQDFAATARKDANKTATELELATNQSNSMQISDMDVFSDPYLQMSALSFNIACHQAIFQLCKPPTHPEYLVGDYHLSSASDTEVVKRQEDKQNAKEFFNIVKGTPMAEKLLIFLIERYFPDQADEWKAVLNQPDKTAVINELLNVIQQIPQDALQPEQRLALNSLISTARSLVGQPTDQPIPGSAQQPQDGSAPESGPSQQAVGQG